MVAFFTTLFLPRKLKGFLTAGGLATLFHWLVMALLIAAGVGAVEATTAGAVSGALMNYTLQRRLAFRTVAPHAQTFWRYVGSCLFAWLANLILLFLLINALELPVALAQVGTTGLVGALNYRVYQRLVFREKTV